ncbi:MAG: DUF4082 domain-containing protein, partial [Burkholderiales bacterium]
MSRFGWMRLLAVFLSVVATAIGVARHAVAADPNQGPGGPILVITGPSATFGRYYAEILRNEGLNAFAVSTDISAVTPTALAAYDVLILGRMPLTSNQVTMLTDWVNGGGNLIAMEPHPGLAGLLGITPTGTTLTNGYVLVDGTTPIGSGIAKQTMQFHGTAQRNTLNGASSLATLYTNATTPTSNPAVTLRSVGTNGGQAAAFAYDLATSIVYTRQGNPAWADQERDGFSPIRPDDKFFGAADADLQPDWIDLTKVAIPQADEQQRFFANLILEMNRDRKPLPRFWYFPNGHRAVVLMSGDDHGNNGTAGRFDQFLASSPPGCSVANWECVRGTSYIYPDTPLSDAQAAAYNAAGFEVGLHVDTGCSDYTAASLETFYSQQISDWRANFPSLPPPITQRHHCIVWSDWVSGAKVQFNHGIRLDTNYYYWPPGWVNNVPGHFTGSAMPMRFADLDGTLIDVYQAVTQLTDESGQEYPFTIDTLLDRALGPEQHFGVFTVNAHTDLPNIPEADAVLASALARGVPIVTARQMLAWLDARNDSSFGSLSWNGSALSFSVVQGSGANGLRGLLPRSVSAGVVSAVTRNGSNVAYQLVTIKGIEYAAFPALAGAYIVTYTPDASGPTVTARSPAVGATNVAVGTSVTATFSEALDPATVNTSTFELRNPGGALVAATVSWNAATLTATLTPGAPLTASSTYTATLRGGATDPRIKDPAGNALASNVTWSFTTGTDGCPCTIWPSTATPTVASTSDTGAVNLGVKFRSDVSGFITGIRFYKGSANTGTHVGRLWSSTGQQLATATFSNETASGWQQVNFATPVAITANTVYVASYHAPNGRYAINTSYFASSGQDRPPLHALQNGVSGGNGVYVYGASPAFPSSTYQSSNYWVDVVFVTSLGPDTTAPTVAITTPTSAPTFSTGTTPLNLGGTASDNVGVTQVSWTNDRGGSGVASGTTTWSVSGIPLQSGVNLITVTARDAANNPGTATLSVTYTPDTSGPTVTGRTPAVGATNVALGTSVTATFNEALDPATVNTSTFELRNPGGALVAATVSWNAATLTATLTPGAPLTASSTYTATLRGGA